MFHNIQDIRIWILSFFWICSLTTSFPYRLSSSPLLSSLISSYLLFSFIFQNHCVLYYISVSYYLSIPGSPQLHVVPTDMVNHIVLPINCIVLHSHFWNRIFLDCDIFSKILDSSDFEQMFSQNSSLFLSVWLSILFGLVSALNYSKISEKSGGSLI